MSTEKFATLKKYPQLDHSGKKEGGNQTEYCEYHQIHGHSTNKCFDLKNVIEKLVRDGKLDRYLATRDDEQRKRRRDEDVG